MLLCKLHLVIIKDDAIGWQDFTQEVAIMLKVKELSNVLRDNIVKQHFNGKCYRAIAMPSGIRVGRIDMIICR